MGKIKEPFVYEMVGDAANLQQMERILSPFFVSRNVGIKLSNTALDQRMRWEGDWFNDWWVAGDPRDESGNNFAGRVTFLPQWEENGERYVHVGVAGRYIGPEGGTLRFKGRPESNVADNFVDTGSFTGDHAHALGLEAIWNRGPFMVSSEYARAWVDSAETGNPRFWGFYIVGSYVLTGEHRPYDRNAGYARRVMPESKFGAWEVVGRYSHIDLDDRNATGGILDKWYAGVNWWATRRWKFGLGYGLAQLDRVDTNGTTHIFLSRLQWIY